LQDFRAQYPAVTLEISATDRMIDLMSEGIDAVVRLAVLQDSELICRKIGDVPMLTCAGAGYLAEFGVPETPADLADHHLVNYALRMPAVSSEWDGLEDGREIAVAMQSHLCVDNAECYIAGALHGHGLIQVPVYDVADDIAAGRLVEVLSKYRPSPVPITILYARRRHLALRLRAFMDWLQELLQAEGVVANARND
jgi:DNA-binding transcriptional LysR family regulator